MTPYQKELDENSLEFHYSEVNKLATRQVLRLNLSLFPGTQKNPDIDKRPIIADKHLIRHSTPYQKIAILYTSSV